ncbi:MAG: ABC transporter permease [Usitatibacter sp.]
MSTVRSSMRRYWMSTSPSDLAASGSRGLRSRLGAVLLNAERLTQVASIVAGLLIWELVATQYSAFILPPPSAVLRRLFDPAFDLKLLKALYGALQHMLAGFGLAVAVAVPLGILMGRHPRINAMLDPLVSALYAIPSVAFVPFLVIWFGLFFESRVALVFIMAFPDMLIVITAGARDIKRNLFAVGRSFGASPLQIALKVTLPAMLPFLMTAFRVGIARAINGMITAELFLAAVNLGAMMKDSARTFDSAGVLTVVVVVCLLGLTAQALIAALEARLLHWHHR